MPWFRVTFRGPQLSPDVRAALDTDDMGVVHDREVEDHDPEHHTTLVLADTGEDAIEIVMTALEPHGTFDFFEAFVWPDEGTMERL